MNHLKLSKENRNCISDEIFNNSIKLNTINQSSDQISSIIGLDSAIYKIIDP